MLTSEGLVKGPSVLTSEGEAGVLTSDGEAGAC